MEDQHILLRHFVQSKIEDDLYELKKRLKILVFNNQELKDEKQMASVKHERDQSMLYEIIRAKEKAKNLVEAENEALITNVKDLNDVKVEYNKKVMELIKSKEERENKFADRIEKLMRIIEDKEDVINVMKAKNKDLETSLGHFKSIFSDMNKVMKRAEEITSQDTTNNIDIESIISDIISDATSNSENNENEEIGDSTSSEPRSNPVGVEVRNNRTDNLEKDSDKSIGISEDHNIDTNSFKIKVEIIEESVNDSYNVSDSMFCNNQVQVELDMNNPVEVEKDSDKSICIKLVLVSNSFKIKDEIIEESVNDSDTVSNSMFCNNQVEEELNMTQNENESTSYVPSLPIISDITSDSIESRNNKIEVELCTALSENESRNLPHDNDESSCINEESDSYPLEIKKETSELESNQEMISNIEPTETYKNYNIEDLADSNALLKGNTQSLQKKKKKPSHIRKTSPLSLFHCPYPGCQSTLGSANARKIHIAIHFKDIIIGVYSYRKNGPCPLCEKTIKGTLYAYIYHMACVHSVVSELLPEDDQRMEIVRKYLKK